MWVWIYGGWTVLAVIGIILVDKNPLFYKKEESKVYKDRLSRRTSQFTMTKKDNAEVYDIKDNEEA